MTLLDLAAGRLREAGITDPRFEAKLLLGFVLGRGSAWWLTRGIDEKIERDRLDAFRALIERRCAREPLSHLVGRREFWSLEFFVNADVLDPRPDSETLIESALALLQELGSGWRTRPWRILDLGTGSGCLLLAMLHELPQALGLGVDCSDRALEVAKVNAASLGLDQRAKFQLGDWGGGLDQQFDMVLSNPPYIPTGDIDDLMAEVARFDPRLALDGGSDGLDAYRMIAPRLPDLLDQFGRVLMEVGANQAEAVGRCLASNGISVIGSRADLAGRPRVVIGAADWAQTAVKS
jgi:release factor glutamine methyltransferase